MEQFRNIKYSLCKEEPVDSLFQIVIYPKGTERFSNGLKQLPSVLMIPSDYDYQIRSD